MAKYGRVAEQNNLRFIPAVFSHTGQIHGEFKARVKEQIRHKLIAFEGEAKCSKIRSVMKKEDDLEWLKRQERFTVGSNKLPHSVGYLHEKNNLIDQVIVNLVATSL